MDFKERVFKYIILVRRDSFDQPFDEFETFEIKDEPCSDIEIVANYERKIFKLINALSELFVEVKLIKRIDEIMTIKQLPF